MGTLSIPTSGRVYVDANAVIYAVEHIEPYCLILEPLWQVFQRIAGLPVSILDDLLNI